MWASLIARNGHNCVIVDGTGSLSWVFNSNLRDNDNNGAAATHWAKALAQGLVLDRNGHSVLYACRASVVKMGTGLEYGRTEEPGAELEAEKCSFRDNGADGSGCHVGGGVSEYVSGQQAGGGERVREQSRFFFS